MKKKILISIPAYNEANNIRPLYKKLNETLEKKRNEVDFEILFINDGSKDNTVSEVLSLIEQTDNVSLIDLSRNYGKEIAMSAGFDYSTHDAVITMDADLQHPPATIIDMIDLWQQGYEEMSMLKEINAKGSHGSKKHPLNGFIKY